MRILNWLCPIASMLEHNLCEALYGTHWIYLSSCKKNNIILYCCIFVSN